MTILAPETAKAAQPGQFVDIRCGHSRTLRRPVSICDVTGAVLRLVYEVRGSGTAWLAKREPGDSLEILAPLGNGVFPVDDPGEPVLLVGGGVGAPPLLYAARRFEHAHAVLGFRSAAQIILQQDFAEACENLLIATDDGSAGAHGTVAKPMEVLLNKYRFDRVLACGPRPMLKAVAELSRAHSIPCYVSMEERMGCGVGACLVCACKTRAADGNEAYSHVCKDGPVFPAERVVW